MKSLNGIMIVNKSAHKTSHDVVSIIRDILPGVKIGHTGTLDPMATGVLPICLGKATRIAEYIVDHSKLYRAKILLGKKTDTQDITGIVQEELSVPPLNPEEIVSVMSRFTGLQLQEAPLYSALKYKGKPMYYWARKGKDIPRKQREVNIYYIKALSFPTQNEPEIVFEVSCSRGTYIRSLGADIGNALGCGATLSALSRLAVGPFTIDNAHSLDMIKKCSEKDAIADIVYPMDKALEKFMSLELDNDQADALSKGQKVTISTDRVNQLTEDSLVRIYDGDGNFRALGKAEKRETHYMVSTVKYLA